MLMFALYTNKCCVIKKKEQQYTYKLKKNWPFLTHDTKYINIK